MRDASVIPIGGPSYTPRISVSSHSPSASSSSSSSSSSSCYSPTSEHSFRTSLDAQQVQYARSMASHTASMWQRERLAIEKAKLDGTWKGDMTSRTNGSAKPVPGDDDIEVQHQAEGKRTKRKNNTTGSTRDRTRDIKRDLPSSSSGSERRWWSWRRA
ncbi:uncharacterized protein PFL1_03647 [Pseudozyma flocculosa PF-1]|uniref:Uncharacterized protein n=2 Tax=Pseudozyma flocculosa TaxID=84751 RepID=A0A5C3F4D2_9BASI|nr:uncharacterized protein PFL1_03647 [Pseudozyma flocculosa PF-1]EPQ28844.1 hypothetical protein PFL1_03647 [Pseudozyma flocculosa PF-1]SPO39364.1 uncharacterized protein PSFLO_04845 [Pseudozyma flocculosa]